MRLASVLLVLSLFILVGCGALEAHSRGHGAYDVELICDGSPCQEVGHRGRRWVVAHFGSRYTVRVRNGSDRWVEAVVTVDGKDVLNGNAGSYHNRGYLVPPHGSVDIDGWRTSASDVAAFRFTSVPDSYAGRTGSAHNTGVVGVAFFPERRPPMRHRRPVAPPPDPFPYSMGERSRDEGTGDLAESAPDAAPRAGSGDAAKSSGAARGGRGGYDRPRQNIGTQYGERLWSQVTEVDFVRSSASRPDAVLEVYYDDVNGLASKGVPVPSWPRPHPYYHEPAPFPETRWVPPPP